MRRADIVLEELALEQQRRDGVRRAIVETFEVTGDARFVVRRRHVHEAVRAALDEPLLRPDFIARINQVVVGMGGLCIRVAHRHLFRGVRRRELSEADAIAEARRLRLRSGVHGAPGNHGNPGGDGNGRNVVNLLTQEGMPPELEPTRPIDVKRAEINRARYDKIEDLYWLVDEERAILRLTLDGLSVRDVADRLKLNRNHVWRVLQRLEARREEARARPK